MAIFYVGYLIAVTSTIAFIVAILTPRWIYPNIYAVNATYPASPIDTNYEGIFYVDRGFPNTTCRDWILTYKDSVAGCRPGRYLKKPDFFNISSYIKNIILVYAVACAALSIIAASLSIILLWLAGGYLYVRRRRLAPHFVSFLAALTLLICKLSLLIYIIYLCCYFY